jgi:MFS transporter, UMF1 family
MAPVSGPSLFMSIDGRNNPKVIRAWTMYDWSISVYNLVIGTTFFPIYFLTVTSLAFGEDNVPLLGRTFKNSALYDYTLSVAYLLVSIMLPMLSSISDSVGNKKIFMKFFTYVGGAACVGMFWFRGENVGWGILCLMLAAMGYVGSMVFYNSYLPEICTEDQMDKVSARGYAMGYIGSVLLQMIGFALVLYFTSKTPPDKASGPLITFVLTGLWWVGFSQIPFYFLKDRNTGSIKEGSVLTRGFVELKKVWLQVKELTILKWYLVAFFFYSMGVQTVMLAATIFGAKVLGLPTTKLIITIVIIQIVGVLGAFLISRLSRSFGNLNILIMVVFFWILICVSAYEIANIRERGASVEVYFYLLAACVGLVMGGIQALSRSTYSKLMPETKDTASFFSFYDVTEKVAIVIGIFSFGFIDELFGMKHSVLALVIFFVLGLCGLLVAREKQRKTKYGTNSASV